MVANQVFDSQRIRPLPVPDDTGTGVPVQAGAFVGVTVTSEGANQWQGIPAGYALVALDGAFDLLVGTVTELAVGDPVYITPDGDLTTTDDDGANTLFGTALSVKGAQAEVIEVEVGGSGGGSAQPGASETDGVGAMFYGGFGLVVPLIESLSANKVYSDFVTNDEPPRAPQRDDLMVVDPEDNTTINIVRSGLYDISLNVPLTIADVNLVPNPVEVMAVVKVEINDDSEFPITAYNNRAFWHITEAGEQYAVTLNLTFPQVLLADDTLRLSFSASQDAHDLDWLVGNLRLLPDITFLLTYRGTVTLPE